MKRKILLLEISSQKDGENIIVSGGLRRYAEKYYKINPDVIICKINGVSCFDDVAEVLKVDMSKISSGIKFSADSIRSTLFYDEIFDEELVEHCLRILNNILHIKPIKVDSTDITVDSKDVKALGIEVPEELNDITSDALTWLKMALESIIMEKLIKSLVIFSTSHKWGNARTLRDGTLHFSGLMNVLDMRIELYDLFMIQKLDPMFSRTIDQYIERYDLGLAIEYKPRGTAIFTVDNCNIEMWSDCTDLPVLTEYGTDIMRTMLFCELLNDLGLDLVPKFINKTKQFTIMSNNLNMVVSTHMMNRIVGGRNE